LLRLSHAHRLEAQVTAVDEQNVIGLPNADAS